MPLTASTRRAERFGLGACAVVLAALAAAAPLLWGAPIDVVGWLLILAALLEALHSARRGSGEARRTAYRSAGFTLFMGLVVLGAPHLVGTGLVLLLGGSYVLDGLRWIVVLWRGGQGRSPALCGLAAAGNLVVAVILLLLWDRSPTWTVVLAGALRILGTGWSMFTAPTHSIGAAPQEVTETLGLPDEPELTRLAEEIAEEERGRRGIDRGWIVAFVATLFAIHVGRMSAEWTLLGFMAPAVAVAGDIAVALILAFGVVGPARLGFRRVVMPLERRAWTRVLDHPRRGWPARCLRAWLVRRLRVSIRIGQSRYSVPFALERALQTGLPLVAVLVATVPIWGMSWYFDTENWAAGIYNSWAAHRTDAWREAIVRSVKASGPEPTSASLTMSPPGLEGDWSFLVIGDPGEGDASQHVLRDQIIRVGDAPDLRFMVISSDVVYPTGSMKDYETNFWLPFKGFVKPVYAIPGNHDWYDALEGFAATFFEPAAARRAIRARVEADRRLTSTTDGRIAWLVDEAARLRQEYGVPTGFQRAPYFQIRTERFVLIAIDTGVRRSVDPDQTAWLRSALEQARGRFKMVILGHPLYAGGRYQASGDEEFTAIHRLLREHEVALVMAGDTHDLEYYVERYTTPGGERVMRHVVNGGGGAYLSSGGALAWPERPAVAAWAFYPSTDAVLAKIDRLTPRWKWPFWVWTKRFGAWPFTAEWLSAAFDYNVAPFHQSFVEVRVEPSTGTVRLRPYGVHGRLQWADLQVSSALGTARVAAPVEVVLPMDGAAARR